MGTRQIVFLRNSERQDYKRCRFLWNIIWNRKLKPKHTANALKFGDLIHRSLEPFYKPGKRRGPHPAKTFAKLYAKLRDETHAFGIRQEDEEWIGAEELGPAMLNHYIERYGKDERIEVIAAEQPIQVDLFNPKNDEYLVTAVGTLDVVYRDTVTGEIGIIDHKTAKAIQTGYLNVDEQAGTYWAIAEQFLIEQGMMEPGQHITHILYNFLRKAKPDQRPRNELGQYLNKDGTVSKKQPSDYFHREPVWRDEADRENILWRIRAEYWEQEQVRLGLNPLYKTPTRDCGFCPVRDVCELHETGGDFEELLKLSFVPWEPYDAHNRFLGGERWS